MIQHRDSPDAATLLGSGKVEELALQLAAAAANLAIFDIELTPTQLRNLERALQVRVIDRTQLILDIFARRARTREGQLEVELAQLNYLLPRLAGRGAQMSRLGGGIGTRGPGESQLETGRRQIARRIRRIEQDLNRLRRGRGIQRRQRQAAPLATIALAGYTNAGKSTLFNRLTGAGVEADSRMFATLDPTVRQARLPSRRTVLFSDTVGFIRNLPTTLVKAFRATLEEVVEARLILHVVDAASPHAVEHTAHVQRVLHEIGAGGTPQLLVLNQWDRVNRADPPGRLAQRLLSASEESAALPSVAVSARTGEGIKELLASIDDLLPLDPLKRVRFRLAPDDGASLHLLHERAVVHGIKFSTDCCEVDATAPESVRRQLSSFLL